MDLNYEHSQKSIVRGWKLSRYEPTNAAFAENLVTESNFTKTFQFHQRDIFFYWQNSRLLNFCFFLHYPDWYPPYCKLPVFINLDKTGSHISKTENVLYKLQHIENGTKNCFCLFFVSQIISWIKNTEIWIQNVIFLKITSLFVCVSMWSMFTELI